MPSIIVARHKSVEKNNKHKEERGGMGRRVAGMGRYIHCQ